MVSRVGADDTGAGILHIDMDAFYASVAVLDRPELKGKPLIIGGKDARSVVSSASYEARRYGVRSAMPVGRALQLCPTAEVVETDFTRYAALSRQVMAIFRDVTPLVEPLSIDEAFLDVSGARRLWGSPGTIAHAVRARVLEETGLTCSVGAAATKHVAKMASTLAKPDGVLIVPEEATHRFLAGRPVEALWGIGPKAAEVMHARGIRVVRDVLQTPPDVLERALGPAMGAHVLALAEGRDPRPVTTERVEKSIGHEETFRTDVTDRAVLVQELLRLSDRVGARLRANDLRARSVAIKIRSSDFSTRTRTRTLGEGTDVGQRIGQVATELFAELDPREPVRLVGVRAERLARAGESAALWDDDADRRALERRIDDAVARFGAGALTRAALVRPAATASSLPTAPRLDDAFGDAGRGDAPNPEASGRAHRTRSHD